MRLSDHEINAHLRDKLQNVAGRHLYVVLGTYEALDRYEKVALPELRGPNNQKIPAPVNVNRTLLERFPDEELKKLVQSEARRPEHIKQRLYDEFDRLLTETLADQPVVALKQLELLFAFDLELDKLRIRAVNQKHILLLLPGEQASERIMLFHEASPQWHRTLPATLVPEDHLCELTT